MTDTVLKVGSMLHKAVTVVAAFEGLKNTGALTAATWRDARTLAKIISGERRPGRTFNYPPGVQVAILAHWEDAAERLRHNPQDRELVLSVSQMPEVQRFRTWKPYQNRAERLREEIDLAIQYPNQAEPIERYRELSLELGAILEKKVGDPQRFLELEGEFRRLRPHVQSMPVRSKSGGQALGHGNKHWKGGV